MATPEEKIDQGEAWAAKTADQIESLVGTLRDKTVGPLIKVTRGIVYGILVLVGVLVISVFICIALIRILDVYAFENRVWISYFVVGGIMTILGLFVWMKRTRRK